MNNSSGVVACGGEKVVKRLGIEPEVLAEAHTHCRRVTAEHGKNFYVGLRLTPEPRRSALFAMYAWMRAGDDAVDEAGEVEARQVALERFEQRTRQVLQAIDEGKGLPDELLSEPMWTAFAGAVGMYGIEASWIWEMVQGLSDDLTVHDYERDEDLRRYCYRVASTVGLVCMAIWGLREGVDVDRARELAIERGQAFQRTNILRDFAEDFDAEPSRVYVPRECFLKHDLTPVDLRSWAKPKACEALYQEQIGKARQAYEASAELNEMIDASCVPTLWAMTRIYRGVLERIAMDPRRSALGERVGLTGGQKLRIGLAAMVQRARAR